MRITPEAILAVSLIVVAVAIVAAICMTDFSPVEGTVTGKGYCPASTSTQFMYMPDGNGGMYMIPYTQYHSEYWYVMVGKRSATVSREFYESVKIGDWFSQRR